jgi:formylglycine-generating enzyme required for sulfatase activity
MIRWALVALTVVIGVASSAFAREPIPVPAVVEFPAGTFIRGSYRAERDYAYRLDEAAYSHNVTRRNRWYEDEPRQSSDTAAYEITQTPITNGGYAAFVRATNRTAPDVDPPVWAGYRLINPWERTRKFAWRDGAPPSGRADHPVVLVSHTDAIAYAKWLSRETGRLWRLPSEAEWEKAARGTDGRRFPWGNVFDLVRLNSHDRGPFDTVRVGRFWAGASPFGLLDGAGQVFEWTAAPAGLGRHIVKGGSWDDKGCGVCRRGRAARVTRRHQAYSDRLPVGSWARITVMLSSPL